MANYDEKTKDELVTLCKRKGIKTSGKTKKELITALKRKASASKRSSFGTTISSRGRRRSSKKSSKRSAKKRKSAKKSAKVKPLYKLSAKKRKRIVKEQSESCKKLAKRLKNDKNVKYVRNYLEYLLDYNGNPVVRQKYYDRPNILIKRYKNLPKVTKTDLICTKRATEARSYPLASTALLRIKRKIATVVSVAYTYEDNKTYIAKVVFNITNPLYGLGNYIDLNSREFLQGNVRVIDTKDLTLKGVLKTLSDKGFRYVGMISHGNIDTKASFTGGAGGSFYGSLY